MKLIYKYSGSLSFLWALIIFVLCATPGQYIPSAGWLEVLSIDKWIHASIFFILTGLFFLTAIKHKQSNRFLVIYLFINIAYGASLEWMQANVFTNRSADWQDIVANTLGCLMALALIKKFRKFYKKTLLSKH